MAALLPRGYRSVTEYHFREDQSDAIVRTAAYHRKDYCHSVIWFSPREHVGILVSYGLKLFCALLRTRLATCISLLDFYHVLCTKACSLCGEFAGFQFRLTKAELAQLRSFKTLPGTYSMKESVYKSRITVVSLYEAKMVSRQQPPTPAAQAQPANSARNRKFNFMGSCALPYYNRRTGIIGSRGEKWALEARDKVYAQDDFLEHFRWCEQAQILWRSSGEGNSQPTELPEAARRGGDQAEIPQKANESPDFSQYMSNSASRLSTAPQTHNPSTPSSFWTVASISRDKASGDLWTSLLNRTFAGVKCQWNYARIKCLELEKTKQLTAMVFEAVSHSIPAISLPPPATKTRAYQLLEGSGLAPRFLGHVHENGRIMRFLLEKAEGRPASFQDLSACETALRKLHALGLVHGDVNRYNFLVTEAGAKLLDFECLRENASPESMSKELENLRAELVDESGCGGGFIFHGDSKNRKEIGRDISKYTLSHSR
ncbi:cyclin f-box [Achaetomium macrosporum]|uniref:Cyclin f-box n=1 Tax=Achaetomium macrosporum TaxID=79813 RepID=A0AAN7HEZ5_9PEZI|nr:cyclin f-box [Achaetomium macrosporum]